MEEKPATKRLVLVPVPAQGHISPMMQLAKTLHLKGFSITVVQTKFNYFTPSDDFTDFQFVTIPESLSETDFKNLGPIEFQLKLNKEYQGSFKDCLGQLLLEQSNEISCVIYDEFMYFAEAAAKEFKLPNVIFSTTSATAFVCRSVFDKLYANNVLAPLKEPKGQQEELVPEFHPLRYKDFPVSRFASLERIKELYKNTVDKRTASSVIINTASCLESSSLSFLQQQLEIQVYPIGPLHIVASAPTSFFLKLCSLLPNPSLCIAVSLLSSLIPPKTLCLSLCRGTSFSVVEDFFNKLCSLLPNPPLCIAVSSLSWI